MTQTSDFADRIRSRYPEGLTGVFAPGGTRTTYILGKQRGQARPGSIDDFADYADYGINRLFDLIEMFFELGGQNIVIPLFSYQGFYERGEEYARLAADMFLRVITPDKTPFYQKHNIDPHITGIDTMLHLPESHYAHAIALQFEQFRQTWPYQAGRRKVIWEVAPIPLFSILKAHEVMGAEAEADLRRRLAGCTDLKLMHDMLYQYYARAVYGTDIPMPHFYLGANRNSDLKLRALLPIALLCGGPFRLYYTPYPSLFMKRETLQAILEDLAFGKPLRSTTTDYTDQITTELVEAEYQRMLALSADPYSTTGLLRQIDRTRSSADDNP